MIVLPERALQVKAANDRGDHALSDPCSENEACIDHRRQAFVLVEHENCGSGHPSNASGGATDFELGWGDGGGGFQTVFPAGRV